LGSQCFLRLEAALIDFCLKEGKGGPESELTKMAIEQWEKAGVLFGVGKWKDNRSIQWTFQNTRIPQGSGNTKFQYRDGRDIGIDFVSGAGAGRY
jgi:hypothetical protein